MFRLCGVLDVAADIPSENICNNMNFVQKFLLLSTGANVSANTRFMTFVTHIENKNWTMHRQLLCHTLLIRLENCLPLSRPVEVGMKCLSGCICPSIRPQSFSDSSENLILR